MPTPSAQHRSSPDSKELLGEDSPIVSEIMRCSELIPLDPELPLLIKLEQKLIAAWESEVAQLQDEGWRVIRRSRTESPLTATYRLFYQFSLAQTATG